jgi:hypothetical protein
MQLPFAKWHGTGNDFILVDDRVGLFRWVTSPLCGTSATATSA